MTPATRCVVRRGKATAELVGSEWTIGTRSTCAIVLDDPIAAQVHCVLHAGRDGVFVEARPTSTGTFLDGVEVTDRTAVRAGSELVVGVTRIRLEEIDPRAGQVTLEVAERSFHYVAKKREEFHSDADEWVRAEVRFGRFRALRAANVAALVASLALVALALSPGGRGSVALSPGRLSDPHHRLFQASAEELAASQPPHVVAAVAAGCAACHGADHEVEATRCGVCHEELVGALVVAGAAAREAPRHPFVLSEGVRCSECHREHLGAPAPLPADHGQERACADCHAGDDFADTDAAVALAMATWLASDASPAATAGPSARRGFEGFSHGTHAGLECAECHAPAGEAAATDFAPSTFATCIGCHGDAAGDTGGAAVAAFRVALDPATHAGVGERCVACHDPDAGRPGALQVARVPAVDGPALEFAIQPRGHAELADAGSCGECHIGGLDRANEPRRAAFAHVTHLTHPFPESPLEAAVANAECVECHAAVSTAVALSAAPPATAGEAWVPGLGACASCHKGAGASGRNLVLESAPTPALASATWREVPAFDHAAHADVPGGCVECHAPDSSGRVVLRAERSCRDCHVEAEATAGLRHAAAPSLAACDACHPGVEADRLAPVFYPSRAESPGAARASAFDHGTPGHGAESCATCHGDPATDGDVRRGATMGESCIACHARRRFHWR